MEKKTILLIGGSGFLGQQLGEALARAGKTLKVLSRSPEKVRGTLAFPAEVIEWDGRVIPPEALSGCEAVVNLAGASIFGKRWTSKQKKEILESRIQTTQALVSAISKAQVAPTTVIQGSAVGFYPEVSSDPQREDAQPGTDFLSKVCVAWENTAKPLAEKSRLVIIRTGLVMGWTGGALPELNLIYGSGLGAKLGDGQQWTNWIHVDDWVSFVLTAIDDPKKSGIYNLVAPENARNSTLHQTFKKFFSWTIPVPAPSLALKLLLGQQSVLILKGSQAVADRVLASGFHFRYPSLLDACEDLFQGQGRRYPSAFVIASRQYLPKQAKEIWSFFSDEKNLEELTPKFLKFKVLGKNTEKIEKGTLIEYKLGLHGIPLGWTTKISIWEPHHRFVDESIKGPYKVWRHTHEFTELGEGTLVTDFVEFKLPVFPFSGVALPMVIKDVKKIFAFRKQAIRDLF